MAAPAEPTTASTAATTTTVDLAIAEAEAARQATLDAVEQAEADAEAAALPKIHVDDPGILLEAPSGSASSASAAPSSTQEFVSEPNVEADCKPTIRFGESEGAFAFCQGHTEWEDGYGPQDYERANNCLLDDPDVQVGEAWSCRFITPDGSNGGSERETPEWASVSEPQTTHCEIRFGEGWSDCDTLSWEAGYGPRWFEEQNDCALEPQNPQPGEGWACN